MARYQRLDNVLHRNLRVRTDFGQQFGDAVSLVPAFVTEFAELQREYPIFLRRVPGQDRLQAVALLGFSEDENLFLREGRWVANYLPGDIARGPFVLGPSDQQMQGEDGYGPVIHVDLDHARVNAAGTQGQPVFLPQGGHSPYLQHIVGVLRGIHEGDQAGQLLFATLEQMQLVQPLDLQLRFDQANSCHLTGLLGIDRDRFNALEAGHLHALHRSGSLEGIYLMLASQHNLRHLVAEKQRRLRAGTVHAD